MKDKTIHWGIIGPGRIAAKFAADLRLTEGSDLYAVGSRSLERASAFAQEFGASQAYGSYEELLRDPKLDVVYIASPHTLHKEHTLLALKHKKHVLCEKPLGISASEVNQITEAAGEAGVFLMEALWSRFNPSIMEVYRQVKEGVIGDISYLRSDFAFYALDRDENGRLLNPDLAGGSLLDIGIYPAFLSYLFLGMPEEILATSNFYKTGIEVQTGFIFKYKAAMAVMYSGLNSNSEMIAEISGTQGSFFLRSRWHEANGYSREQDGKRKAIDLPKTGNGYFHEIKEVAACLRSGKTQSDLWSWQDSKNLAALLQQIRDICGISFPLESK